MNNLVLDNIVIAKVTKVLSIINLGNKYIQTISDIDLDVTRDLGLLDIKKYWRYKDQIQTKVDWLLKTKSLYFKCLSNTF